jgi:hypothetical protein
MIGIINVTTWIMTSIVTGETILPIILLRRSLVYNKLRVEWRGGGGAGADDSPFSPSISQSVDSALKRAAELTPTMAMSVKDAMSRAESYTKAQKTKNSSNKNKE